MLKEIKIKNFKSFGGEHKLFFPKKIIGVVGPNGSGKSNLTEAFKFVLGEQSIKTLRSKKGGDLIFNGGNIGKQGAQNALVSLTFDNSSSRFDDYTSEVTIQRTIFRDGTSEYRINKSLVRQKDVVELLSKVNLGVTGYHIISQGEADRVLNSKPQEKREMLEECLGLKLLQYRKKETQKSIYNANQNMKEIESVQREIKPHLNYLKKQIERFEKMKGLQTTLSFLYEDYLFSESIYLTEEKKNLSKTKEDTLQKIEMLKNKINETKTTDVKFDTSALINIKNDLFNLEREKETLINDMGKLNGRLDFIIEKSSKSGTELYVSKQALIDVKNEIKRIIEKEVYVDLNKIVFRLETLLDETNDASLKDLKEKLHSKAGVLNKLKTKEQGLKDIENTLLTDQEDLLSKTKDKEGELIDLLNEKYQSDSKYSLIENKLKIIENDWMEFERELNEGEVLVGETINNYKSKLEEDFDLKEIDAKRKQKRKELEKHKIILESMGSSIDETTYDEYNRLKDKDEFLQKEKTDISESINNLKETIVRLEDEITTKFNEGLNTINTFFGELFKTLFDGGEAALHVEDVEKKTPEGESKLEKGVGIRITLPRKKINSLYQLSGGERALVSVALLFAMSQTTPPPFLILDETDAALDEANSKRYAEMIKVLAEKSQLILVTHNRETMYNTDILYGISMNSTGISKLLSIRFEDAVLVAK